MCPNYRNFSLPALKGLFETAARVVAVGQQVQRAVKGELDRRAAASKAPPPPHR